MKTSVILCTFNRYNQLLRGLETILSQTVLPDEIIVIDDGSTDGTRDRLSEFLNMGIGMRMRQLVFYHYLPHPEPRISCIPRNVGIKKARGEVLFFTEPEALHAKDNFEKMIHEMSQTPDVTVLASQVWTMGEEFYRHTLNLSPEEMIKHPHAMLTEGNMQNTAAPNSDWAITGERWCNAGVFFGARKEWLMKVGGFNEEFTGHGFDDFDLFNRLAIIGHGIRKVDTIPVIHQWHEKNYPYNIYDHAILNGKISEEMVNSGKYEVNVGKEWGKIDA